MELNQKIEQIILSKGMSPSSFADTIGVQRSNISHILSGRNKPSLDIIQRILRVFPDLDRDWLLFDTESATITSPENTPQTLYNQQINPTIGHTGTLRESPKMIQSEEKSVQNTVKRKIERPIVPTSIEPEEKTIDRILIFYSDGTFMEYKPAK